MGYSCVVVSINIVACYFQGCTNVYYNALAVDLVQAPSRLLHMHIQAYLLVIPV